jgi:uncharacterized protein YjbI with pentapeptide repeats
MAVGQLRYRSGLPVTEIRNQLGLVVWSYAFGGPRWEDSHLQEAVLDDVVCEGGVITMSSLADASLKRAEFYWLFAGVNNFAEADLEDCTFYGCHLAEADFSGARLRRTRFLKDNMLGCTRLSGANLSKAIIEDCDFSGAEYDDATRFPEGFDPHKHGMTRAKP